jgi:hypothetical protein
MSHREFELARSIRGVDVDQDRTYARARELQNRPLDAVGCPDTNPIAFLDAESEQTQRHPLDLAGELAVRIPNILMDRYERFSVGKTFDGSCQRTTDGVTKQRGIVTRDVGIRCTGHGSPCFVVWSVRFTRG